MAKEIEEKEVEKEEFFDAKKSKKSLFNRIMNVVLWIVLFIWMGICLFDFFRTVSNKEPKLCIKQVRTTYNDGYVDTCTGIGYKVINYRRTSMNGNQYGPFWITDKSAETK
jgi:hypothetical protein